MQILGKLKWVLLQQNQNLFRMEYVPTCLSSWTEAAASERTAGNSQSGAMPNAEKKSKTIILHLYINDNTAI